MYSCAYSAHANESVSTLDWYIRYRLELQTHAIFNWLSIVLGLGQCLTKHFIHILASLADESCQSAIETLLTKCCQTLWHVWYDIHTHSALITNYWQLYRNATFLTPFRITRKVSSAQPLKPKYETHLLMCCWRAVLLHIVYSTDFV